jgi:hypothetical protein
MQAGAQVAQMPQIAAIADAIYKLAGYQPPTPAGVDPNFPMPQGVLPPVDSAMPPVHQNTSPQFPPVPQQASSPMTGIETVQVNDNLPA